jgi:hypothetical protein
MASKTKKKQTSKTGGKVSSKPTAPVKAKKKERGTLLTIALLVIAIHGVFAAALYYTSAPEVQRPWIISMMVVHFLANVAAAVGIYVYAASTIIALVAGLLAVGIWSTFYMILPLVILGWLIRTKWDYFE